MDISWAQLIVSVVIAVIASSGFWAFMTKLSEKKDIRTQMLIGLGHDRIVYLCNMYINRGYITPDEYENLYDYLYKPYEELGGNGSAKRLMNKVEKLPCHATPGGDCD